MSALLTANQFEKMLPQVVVTAAHPNHATLQSIVTAICVRLLMLPQLWYKTDFHAGSRMHVWRPL